VVDRIRVVSDTGQNMRLHPDTGAIAGLDTALNGGTTSAHGAAYTNSFSGATTATLYVIDAATDALYLQGSPGGTPTSPNLGATTLVGALGVDTTALVGFDISRSGVAYASLQVGGVTVLATINLVTGSAQTIGAFPVAQQPISGIAVSPIPVGCNFDIDGNNTIDPLTDGLLLLRAMFGVTGTAATSGAVGAGATRVTWDQLRVFMNSNCGTSFGP